MKKFCVMYSYTTLADAEVSAENQTEAIKKVKEVLSDVEINGVWEVKSDAVGRAS